MISSTKTAQSCGWRAPAALICSARPCLPDFLSSTPTRWLLSQCSLVLPEVCQHPEIRANMPCHVSPLASEIRAEATQSKCLLCVSFSSFSTTDNHSHFTSSVDTDIRIKVSHKFSNMSDANSPPSSPSAEIKSESGQPLEPPPKLVKHRPSLLPFFPSNDEETTKLFLELFAEDLKAAEDSAGAKVSHS